ncbi:uncharacterized protein LOC111250120 isoform X3 [Varroa destructor]|uniref:RING-type domain-containing protein n=1 Tax=Varroa destructor TaxID=109461 RepID=A0A7M7K2A2_VARDE|nr:uncharacterized protein LOC111250120 isoform X3 [Varroa destructor]
MLGVLIRGLPKSPLEARHVDLLEPPMNVLCQLCSSLVPILFELSCGHLVCKWCCQSSSGMPRFFECPLDNKELTFNGNGTSFRTRAVRTELAVLMSCRAACLNRTHGCSMQGTLQEIVDHLDGCDFDRIECRRCHRHLPRIDLATHINEQCRSASFLPSMVCLESADLWRLGLSLQDAVAEATEKQLAMHLAFLEETVEQIAHNCAPAASGRGNGTRPYSTGGSVRGGRIGRFGTLTLPRSTESSSERAHPAGALEMVPECRFNRHVSASPFRHCSEPPLAMRIQSRRSQPDLPNLQNSEMQMQLNGIQDVLASLAVTLRETQNSVAGLNIKRSFWNIVRFSQIKTNLERCTNDHFGLTIPNKVFRLSHSGHPAILHAQFERNVSDKQFWLAMRIAFRADSRVNMNLEWPYRGEIALMIVHPEDSLLSKQHVLDALRSRHPNFYLRPAGNRGCEEPQSLGGRVVSLQDLIAEGFVAADDSITLAVVTSERITTPFSQSSRLRQFNGYLSNEF